MLIISELQGLTLMLGRVVAANTYERKSYWNHGRKFMQPAFHDMDPMLTNS
jgi:hypothetical protein